MQLSVHDRLILLNLLPSEGDLTTLRIVRDLAQDLGFSDEEHQELGLVNDGNVINWEKENEKPKDVKFGKSALTIVRDQFAQLDRQSKLTLSHLDTYDKFKEDEDEEV